MIGYSLIIFLYTAFMSEYRESQEVGLEQVAQKVLMAALVRLKSMSEYEPITMESNRKTSTLLKSLVTCDAITETQKKVVKLDSSPTSVVVESLSPNDKLSSSEPVVQSGYSSDLPVTEEIARLQIVYLELQSTLSDPLYNSSFEWALAEQLSELYKDNQTIGSEDSYEALCEHIETLNEYLDYKSELYDDPSFISKCETFDIKVVPTTGVDGLAALREHPLAGSSEWHLFDEVLYYSFLSLYNPQQVYLDMLPKVIITALAHLRSISEYSSKTASSPDVPSKVSEDLDSCPADKKNILVPN